MCTCSGGLYWSSSSSTSAGPRCLLSSLSSTSSLTALRCGGGRGGGEVLGMALHRVPLLGISKITSLSTYQLDDELGPAAGLLLVVQWPASSCLSAGKPRSSRRARDQVADPQQSSDFVLLPVVHPGVAFNYPNNTSQLTKKQKQTNKNHTNTVLKRCIYLFI